MNPTNFAELTTLGVGGPATQLVTVTTRDEFVTAFRDITLGHDEWFILGGGSNVVVADAGLDYPVIRVATRGITVTTDADSVLVDVEAGEEWDAVVAHCVDAGWAGIEALSGIPGTAGAAPIQNIGAYGAELSEVLDSIEFIHESTGEIERLAAPELDLGYRHSRIKAGELRGAVLSVRLRLTPSSASQPIRYSQLAGALGVELGQSVELADVRTAVLRVRSAKSMVFSVDDVDSHSAGSFFMNPVVRSEFARDLPQFAPRFEAGVGADGSQLVKLSAAWLIEHSGIGRGFSLAGSNAAVSSKHTLAIVNRGGATADQVMELARFIELRVQQTFGVNLVAEPTYLD